MKNLITVLVLAMLSMACSSSSTENKQEEANDLADAGHQPLDKAKAVEQQIFDSAAQQRREIDGL